MVDWGLWILDKDLGKWEVDIGYEKIPNTLIPQYPIPNNPSNA